MNQTASSSWFHLLALWLRAVLHPAWNWVLDVWRVVRLARVAIAVSILGSVLLVALSQSEDVLLRLGESHFHIRLHFFLVLLLTSLTLWYWTRIAIAFKPNSYAPNKHQWLTNVLVAQLPRIVGLAPSILLAWKVRSQGTLLPGTFIVVAINFLVIWGRRPILRWLHGALNFTPQQHGWMQMPAAHLPQKRSAAGLAVLSVSVLSSLAQLAWALTDPVGFAQEIGAPWTVALLALSGITPVLTVILLLSAEGGVPLFSGLLVATILFSLWTDNHQIRLLPSPPPDRPDLEKALTNWREAVKTDPSPTLILVATSGGASRAAYWTSDVLGGIQDNHSEFAKHVFAISSVSGGSLGAVYFRALLEEKQAGTKLGSYQEMADALLRGDYLGPVVAGMLYGDLMQTVIPFPIMPDRARALEKSWERTWSNVIHTHRMEQAFGTAPAEKDWLPLLLLNGTDVGSGGRWLTGSLIWPEAADPSTARDFLQSAASPIRYSTAADNSARFPGISPPGRFISIARNHPKKVREARIVDGGYYENSGAATVIDLLAEIDRLCMIKGKEQLCAGLRYAVVQLDNDPDASGAFDTPTGSFLGDLLNPLTTLLSTREARAREETERVAAAMKSRNGSYLRFSLRGGKNSQDFEPGAFPLNWVMSTVMMGEMHDRAKEAIEANDGAIAKLLAPP